MTRPYTGFDKRGTGTKPGLKVLVDTILFLNGGKVTNLGTWMVRDMKGKPGKQSVHGTGRAADLGWRDRAVIEPVIDWLVKNADQFGVEYVADYFPRPGGRGWRCDRAGWLTYPKGRIAGAPGGRWIHIEISPAMADNPEAMTEAIKRSLTV
jgi:hypothetical protein